MLTAGSYVGARQGPRFVAFYGCMFYGLMRPAEVARLTKAGCYLPEIGWGALTFGDSSPAPGKEWTNTGDVHEERGLKGRSRKAVRTVPIPPELVHLLRDHIERFGTAHDGRLFRSERGGVIQPSTWWQVWRKVRSLALTPEQLLTPLMERPYDLRHAGITWRLNSGVPAPDVAKWAGHSVEVLTRIYAGCVVGLDDVWIARMNAGLRPDLSNSDGCGGAAARRAGGTAGRAGRELLRRLYQDRLDLTAVREVRRHDVTREDGIPRTRAEKGRTRPLVTKFGQVTVSRIAYRVPGRPNVHPLDAELNLPEEKHSHGLRKLAAIESARGSIEAAGAAVTRATGVTIGKRQLEELARRCAAHVEAFYMFRVISPVPDNWPLVLTFDGKGIVMLPGALRPATAKAAAAAEGKLATRLSPGEKNGRKRMA